MRCSMMSVSRGKVYIDCPEKYRRQYEEGFRSEADHLDLGTIIHTVLERLFRDFGGFADYETVMDMYDEEFRNNPRLSSSEHYKQGIEILETFISSPENFEHEVLLLEDGTPAIELEFYIDLEKPGVWYKTKEEAIEGGKYIYRGFIDKILKIDAETIRVVDYKTSWVPISQSELDEDLQLDGYNLAVRTLFGFPKVEVSLNYVRHGYSIVTSKAASDAEVTRRYLLSLFKKIESDNDPVAKLNDYCAWCDFKEDCPAYRELIDTPVAVPDITEELTMEEQWELREELRVKSKIIEKKMDEIKERFVTYMKDTDTQTLSTGKHKIYLSPNRRSFYQFYDVLEAVGAENIDKVVSVSKTKTEEFLKTNSPESLEELKKKEIYYFNAPTLRSRKKKDNK